MKGTAVTTVLLLLLYASLAAAAEPPNVIYIMADDLGYGDLGCYGQKRIETPSLDKMAAEGIRFTNHYAGSTVCAPSRCVLMTGLHTGHSYIRGNREVRPMGQWPLPPDTVTVAKLLNEAGYRTALIGKWGLGGPGSSGVPNRQGFDYFFGYLCQRHAHNYYPEFLFRNTERVPLEGNKIARPREDGAGMAVQRAQYSHDLCAAEALQFVERNRDRRFFLYLALTIPHANNEAGGKGMEVPSLGPYAEQDWPEPQKGHAAMITRMDADVGRLLAKLKELGLDEKTLVLFTSDNGPHREGGNNPEFNDSNGPLRGIKRDLYEGGIRVPLIARWPAKIGRGKETAHLSAFWDFLPTACEAAGIDPPEQIDGVSYLPTLLGKEAEQQKHEYLYWEYGGKRAVRMDMWKAVRFGSSGKIALYDLEEDLGEKTDVAADHSQIVQQIEQIMRAAHSESPVVAKKPKSQASTASHAVLVEAEGFADLGGWVDDQQFMDEMGSPYLLAHGLGVPVKDATTTVEFPAPGKYRVLVRTRDWVAPWKAPGAPGRFQVLVDGRPLSTTFGTKGAKWHWQEGGTVVIEKKQVTVALHDLTGFEGRCDAILFTTDADFTPPNEDPAMAVFRRKALGLPERPDSGGSFDLVVVGGGIAGTCAALSAARLDLKVALIQDRPVLGGNNSSEVRVWLGGERSLEPFPRIGDVVEELEQAKRAHYGPANTADLYEDDKKLALVRSEKNVSLFLRHRANRVQTEAGRIRAVVAQNTITGRSVRFAGRWFADCTGDGCLGFLAGADHEITHNGHMGRCNLWNVVRTDHAVPFPRCPWALDLSDKPFPGRGNDPKGLLALGGWYWESGFDRDPIRQREYIRDWNFRAMYGAWDALKNVDEAYPNHELNWAAHISGPRESRRLLGDVVLSQEDVVGGKKYTDACLPATWLIDLHLPDKRFEKGFEGDAFISKAHYTKYERPYWVPYRCLYSRNVKNLFMAGRDISVTHEALGAVRVMRTCGMMGEIVGMAAALCKRYDTDPRAVYVEHLDELKQRMTRGVGTAAKKP